MNAARAVREEEGRRGRLRQRHDDLHGAHTATFNGKAILPGGTLTLSGSVYSSPQGLVVPVTGGTGAYAHYKGTLLVGSGSKRVANTYRLTRPSGPVA